MDSHKYLSMDVLPVPSQWPDMNFVPDVPWNTPVLPPGPAQGWAQLCPKHELSRKAHVALVVGSRSQRWSVSQTKLGLVLFFLWSVCLSAAHVAPGNAKPPVSDYKYTINAISDLFFLPRLGKQIWCFSEKKNPNLTLMYSDCHCKYRCFCYAQSTVLMWWPKALRGFDLETWERSIRFRDPRHKQFSVR